MKYLFTIIIALCISSVHFAQDFNIGEKTLVYIDSVRHRPVKVEVWYPTKDTDENKERITDLPFMLEPTIRNAGFLEGRFPLVFLSHGTGANRFGLAWLAAPLVKKGYIVAAPDHWGNTYDNVIPKYFVRYWERPLDISFLITQFLSDSNLSNHINKDKIGMVGFSFGGYTSLALAGAEIDCGNMKKTARLEKNKYEFYVPEFGDLRELIEELPCDSANQIKLKDGRIKAFLAMSPALGIVFEAPEQTKNITAPVLIIGAESDSMTPVLTNAKRYHKLIPSSQYIEIKGDAGHYVFLNVANDALKEEAPLLFTDDKTVNREAVHKQVENEIISFFEKNLLK